MKLFIVLALFAAAASASVIQSPVLGYNTYGSYGYGLGNVYGNTYGLNAGLPLVSGVRTVSPLRYASRVIAPISTIGVRAYKPLVASPVVAPVAAYGVAPAVYSNYGTGLYGNGYLAKKA